MKEALLVSFRTLHQSLHSTLRTVSWALLISCLWQSSHINLTPGNCPLQPGPGSVYRAAPLSGTARLPVAASELQHQLSISRHFAPSGLYSFRLNHCHVFLSVAVACKWPDLVIFPHFLFRILIHTCHNSSFLLLYSYFASTAVKFHTASYLPNYFLNNFSFSCSSESVLLPKHMCVHVGINSYTQLIHSRSVSHYFFENKAYLCCHPGLFLNSCPTVNTVYYLSLFEC